MNGQDIIAVAMSEQIPAGVLGPAPATLDIRSFFVPHSTGLVLVDTGMDASGRALDASLADVGARWSDVSHIVITHGHPDHTGGLHHARESAPNATVCASAAEGIDDARPVIDGDVIASLTVFATPGHTAGHLSLVDQVRGVVFVGDCLGVVDGTLVRAPAIFTSDANEAERSLQRLREWRGARLLFAHGPEISQPWDALDTMLDEPAS